jgi:hypothetical protein
MTMVFLFKGVMRDNFIHVAKFEGVRDHDREVEGFYTAINNTPYQLCTVHLNDNGIRFCENFFIST